MLKSKLDPGVLFLKVLIRSHKFQKKDTDPAKTSGSAAMGKGTYCIHAELFYCFFFAFSPFVVFGTNIFQKFMHVTRMYSYE